MNAIESYSTAKGYVQSAYLIVANPDRRQAKDTTFFLSIHLLIGFAVELYLKSWLLNEGVPESTLRAKNHGHKLDVLYNEALNRGLPRSYDALVNHVGPQHANFEYRYMSGQSQYVAPPIQELFDSLSALDFAVDSHVGASASCGLAPRNSPWIVPEWLRAWVFV